MTKDLSHLTADEYRALLGKIRAEQPAVTQQEAWEQYLRNNGLLEALHGAKSRVLFDIEPTVVPNRGAALVGKLGYAWHNAGKLKSAELRLPDGQNIMVSIHATELLYPAPWKDISDMGMIYIKEQLYTPFIPEGGELHRIS
jgi:hypothetical protein